MKVVLWKISPDVIAVEYNIDDEDPYFIKDVPEDVLDRHDKALAEYRAVQRILELYKNEG